MPHEAPLVTMVAAAVAAAWLLGVLTRKAGLSPMVGYLLAGVLIGPRTPAFVGDVKCQRKTDLRPAVRARDREEVVVRMGG